MARLLLATGKDDQPSEREGAMGPFFEVVLGEQITYPAVRGSPPA